MKDARPWIALLGVVCFLAGIAASTLHRRLGELETDRGPFAAYADRIIEEFELSPERAAGLRALLREYARDIERIRQAREVEFYASLEKELRPTGAVYNGYIRDLVLPPSKRARFDELAAGTEYPTPQN